MIKGPQPAKNGATHPAEDDPAVAAAAQVRLLNLKDRDVNPLGTATGHPTVFLFTRSDCPISNRYAPEIERLRKKFNAQDVGFYLVYPDPQETPAAIQKHLSEFGYQCTPLRDPKHALVDLTGASVTPEAAVFTSDRKLVYRGRIDDRFPKFGVLRKPATHELEDVLDALTEGKPVTLTTTKAIGCYIADLK